ncbi:hypothetical protein GGR57DRAFT_511846 [Xylariaceae sp. FL1272]|nr:hypothetical protein GGR57DRAFT_511846 [Xylariaceae sp. FL1272]
MTRPRALRNRAVDGDTPDITDDAIKSACLRAFFKDTVVPFEEIDRALEQAGGDLTAAWRELINQYPNQTLVAPLRPDNAAAPLATSPPATDAESPALTGHNQFQVAEQEVRHDQRDASISEFESAFIEGRVYRVAGFPRSASRSHIETVLANFADDFTSHIVGWPEPETRYHSHWCLLAVVSGRAKKVGRGLRMALDVKKIKMQRQSYSYSSIRRLSEQD